MNESPYQKGVHMANRHIKMLLKRKSLEEARKASEEIARKKFLQLMRAIKKKKREHYLFLKGELFAYGWFAHSDNLIQEIADPFEGEGLSEK